MSYTYTWQRYPWPVDPDVFFSGFDGVLEDGADPVLADAPDEIGLATDGAKAWTLDGYFRPVYTDPISIGPVTPNLQTGSQIDIQLADDITGAAADAIHVKSILRVMVYAPADGLVQEGEYLWSYQVHQVWAEPIPSKIVLTPSTDYAIAGEPGTGEEQTVVAQVLDQFGDEMPDVEVSFESTLLEGVLTNHAGRRSRRL